MSEKEAVLRAGVGRRDITPEAGGRLFGYAEGVVSQSVSDALRATAVFLGGEGTCAVLLISVEVGLVQTALANRIRGLVAAKTGVDARNVILSATHTHSAPATMGMAGGWGDMDEPYCESIFIPRIVEAAEEAARSPQAAKMGVGTTRSEAGINRRQLEPDGNVLLGQNPWGVFDATMTVIALESVDGKPLANLVHYGAHCTAAYTAPCVSRDWAGVMLDVLERETGTPSLFLQGASGDAGPRLSNGKTVGAFHYIAEIGHVAGLDAVQAYRTIKARRRVGLQTVSGEMAFALQKRMPLEEALAKMGADPCPREKDYYHRVAESYRENLPEQTHFTLPQTLVAAGDVLFIPFPFEVFSEISLRLRACSPFAHTLCLGVANGSHGYLPTQDQICRGGYEIMIFKTESAWPWTDDLDTCIIGENRKLMEALRCTE